MCMDLRTSSEPCSNFRVCFLWLNHIVASSLIHLFIRSFVCCMSHFVVVYVTYEHTGVVGNIGINVF